MLANHFCLAYVGTNRGQKMVNLYDYYVSDDDARQIVALNNAIKTKTTKLLDVIRQKKRTTNNTAISPRMVNYWTEIGVLPLQESNKWHKFSLVDIVFIHIAAKLRDFGLNLEKIKTAKLDLYRLVSLKDENGTEILETPLSVLETAFLLAFALKSHGNIYLMITNSGQATYMTEESLELNRQCDNVPDAYIYLNLNDLLHKTEIINNIRAEIHHETRKYALDDNEKQVVDALRQDNLEKIEITKDRANGKLTRMDAVTDITNKIDAENTEYGEVQTKIQHGQIVRKTLKKTIKFE